MLHDGRLWVAVQGEDRLLVLNSADGSVAARIELDILGCEFGPILPREGRTHNLYVGAIQRLSVRGSWFHQGHKGHLLKSRAALNHILYNRLTDEIGGRASFRMSGLKMSRMSVPPGAR